MIKKISYIIIIACIYAVPIAAQSNDQRQQKVSKLLQNIKNNIAIIDKNLSATCAKKILEVPKEFQKADTVNLSRKNMQQLLRAAKLFISYKSPGGSCSSKNTTIKKYDDSTKRLINELKTLINQIENSSKNKVQLKINVVDSSTNKTLNTRLSIVPVGSVDTLKIPLRNSKDTAGFFSVSILPGQNYLVSVNDSLFVHYYTQLSLVRDSSITIKLQRIISAATGNLSNTDSAISKNDSELYTGKKFIESHIFLLISIVALFFLTLSGVVLYIKKLTKSKAKYREEYKLSLQTIAELQVAIKVKDTMIDSPKVELPVAETFPEQIKEEQISPLPIKQSEVTDTTQTNRNFICEILMTAGPRKKFMNEPDADKDLGEDVCGLVSDTKNVLFWVLDGTSDLHCLKNPVDKREYFSSRLLAQFLAENIRNGFIEKSEKEFDEMVVKAIEEAKKDFLKTIDQLPDEEKMVLKKNIENKNFPECATTILTGRLSLNGDFIAYRSGDSKMFLFSSTPEINLIETSLAIKNDQSNDRLFFRLMLDANGRFDIFFNYPDHEIITEKSISAAISFSDGIGMNTELLLKEEYKKSPVKIRREIAYQLQGTGDDKTICFIEIKETK